MNRPVISLLAAAAALIAAPAGAHVVLNPGQAAPGAYYAGAFRVSHGCSGSPTVSLRVTIPAGVVTAKPRPKAGWTLSIEREPLAQPVKGEGGQTLRERVKAVTWRGRLPDDEFDEFGLMMKLPDAAGPLYFPAVQTCESGENRWVEIPVPGAARPATPAPKLDVTAAAHGDAMAGMHHHP
jgi:uncharacterized protein YcnI